MMWKYAGNASMFPWMMVCMMIVIAVAYIIFLIASWRLMRAHEYIAESMKEINQHLKSKLPGNVYS